MQNICSKSQYAKKNYCEMKHFAGDKPVCHEDLHCVCTNDTKELWDVHVPPALHSLTSDTGWGQNVCDRGKNVLKPFKT